MFILPTHPADDDKTLTIVFHHLLCARVHAARFGLTRFFFRRSDHAQNSYQKYIGTTSVCSFITVLMLTIAPIIVSAKQSPFRQDATELPARIHIEHFDQGAAGVAYYDTTPGNAFEVFRQSDVDIGPASDGGYSLGYADVGEWLEYTVVATAPGTYSVSATLASQAGGGSVLLAFNGATKTSSPPLSIGDTGGWQQWTTSTRASLRLNQGVHVLRMTIASGRINIRELNIELTQADALPVAYPHYKGYYPGFSLLHDERFDRFNTDVWEKGDGAVVSESDCRFVPNAVTLRDGYLQLDIQKHFTKASFSNDHQKMMRSYDYACGELRTKPDKGVHYGRFEARMKAPNAAQASGYVMSLFTYYNHGLPRYWEEIDVEVQGAAALQFQANLIFGINTKTWADTRKWGAWEHKIDIPPTYDWRVFAIEWTPESIRWFVDGKQVKVLTQSDIDCAPMCNSPQLYAALIPNHSAALMLNFWIPTAQVQDTFGGNTRHNIYPLTALYDWVRIYQLDSHPLESWR